MLPILLRPRLKTEKSDFQYRLQRALLSQFAAQQLANG